MLSAKARSFRPRSKSTATATGRFNSFRQRAKSTATRETAAVALAEEESTGREASIGKLSAEELAAWVAAGRSIPRRALAKSADGAALAWAPTSEPQVLVLEAPRGKDGTIGLEIRDDFGLGIYNVIVAIIPGSIAEAQGLFMLGDVVLEVDGVRCVPEDETQPTLELRHVLEPGKASYRFTVLRAVNSLRNSLRHEEAAAAAHGPEPAAAAAAAMPAPPRALERIAAAEGAPPAAAAPPASAPSPPTSPASPASPKRFKLDLTPAVSPPTDEPAPLAEEAAPLFDATTPRSLIFAHAAALRSKHQKLARARRGSLPPSTPRAAEQACDALANQPAATDPDINLTIRRAGRSVDDLALCV